MALMKSNVIPNDAVVLSEIEATSYIWDVVTQWESLSDTWALRYGPAVLGATNALSGVLINNFYRRKLKLGNYGFFASVIPISILPGMLTALFHRHLISTEMLLMRHEACPICYEVRSAATQWSLGLVYPLVLGATSGLMLASRYNTYRVPELKQGVKTVYQFLGKISKPFRPTLINICAMQLIASSVITYYEMKNNITLKNKLIEIERKILSE